MGEAVGEAWEEEGAKCPETVLYNIIHIRGPTIQAGGRASLRAKGAGVWSSPR